MSPELKIRNMTRSESEALVSWAAREGWNPGLHDAELFWATDPKAFIAAELEGKLIGGGAITSYNGGEFGFMGLFIVHPDYRSRGFGNTLWHMRRQRLLDRLRPGASIGMDGVFDMQPYYAKGGFVFSHRNLRFQTEIIEPPALLPDEANVVPLAAVSFDEVLAYDSTCFPAERPQFLKGWTAQADALAVGYLHEGRLAGYGVVRRCQTGCKIGPLFANNQSIADALYAPLARFAIGGPLFLDAPENNPAAMAFVAERNMTEVFGCARMYLGPFPDVAHERIFGVTTFELG